MNVINSTYSSYIADSSYVYKSCQKQYIVIMKKLTCSHTNEARTHVDLVEKANFRANKLNVILIFNKFSPSTTVSSITNSRYTGTSVTYTVGSSVTSDSYDEDINIVKGHGIHYYKTIAPAFYAELSKLSTYTGPFTSYYDGGNTHRTGTYTSGVKTDEWITYFVNGNVFKAGSYTAGLRTGTWTVLHNDIEHTIWAVTTYTAGINTGGVSIP